MSLWVFGYGSLVWRPDFPHAERRPGRVHGHARRFWQGSTDHRGVPGAPGRVVTLVPEPAASTWGVAWRVAPGHEQSVLARLDHRERGGYDRLTLTVQGRAGGSVQAITYVATPDNPNWLGPAPVPEIAATIRRSVGPSGPNDEYLRELWRALRAAGENDAHVEALVAALGWTEGGRPG